jgi:hypothetical protein
MDDSANGVLREGARAENYGAVIIIIKGLVT